MASSEKVVLGRIMPFTVAALKFYGVTVHGSNCLIRLVIRPIVCLVFLTFIVIVTLNMFDKFQSGRFLVDIAVIIVFGAQVVLIYSVQKNKDRAQKLIHSAVEVLNQMEILEIKKSERKMIIFMAGYPVFQLLSTYGYIMTHNGLEVNFLIWGIKSESKPIAMVTMSLAMYAYAELGIMITYYVTTSNVLVAHANHYVKAFQQFNNSLLDLTNERLHSIKRNIRFHSEFLAFVNELMGLIPFMYLAVSFATWVGGFSFLMANHGVDFTILFILAEVGLPIITATWIAMMVSNVCGKMVQCLEKVKDEATEIASGVESIKENKSLPDLRERKRALTAFLCRQPPTVITAWNMFDMNKSLILGFCNAVIPFTVMVATTMGQLKDAPPTLSVNNSTI